MLKRISALDYDSSSIALFVHTTDALSDKKVADWLNEKDFAARKIFTSTDSVTEPMARKAALQFMIDESQGYPQFDEFSDVRTSLQADIGLLHGFVMGFFWEPKYRDFLVKIFFELDPEISNYSRTSNE